MENPHAHGYQRLFRAVIEMAVKEIRTRPDAAVFLTADAGAHAAWRERVCEMAGFDSDAVREGALRLLAQRHHRAA